MALTVVDSDILIDFLRDTRPGADRLARALTDENVATTMISAFELFTGGRNAGELEGINRLLDSLTVLDLDMESVRLAADIKRSLLARGLPLATGDILIAGITIRHGGVLLTRNLRHFDRVPGLVLEPI
jgi:predicted nucleic acid-binding protein